uniref:Uncharacterized protein n=1 Tax=Lepisosteus oculatus TaxID=7918 RepID=W5MQJ1_LEPOC
MASDEVTVAPQASSSADHDPRGHRKKGRAQSERGSGGAELSKARAEIEELTAAGHQALLRGDRPEALACFKKAFLASLQDWAEAARGFQEAGRSYRAAGRLESAAVALREAGSCMLRSRAFSEEDVLTVLRGCWELGESVQDQRERGDLYNDVGLAFSQLKRFPEAAAGFERALPLAGAEPRRRAVVLQNLGAVRNALGEYPQSLEYHRQAASLHGSLGNRSAQGQCFSNLAFALSQLGEHEEAGECYLHALQAFKDTGLAALRAGAHREQAGRRHPVQAVAAEPLLARRGDCPDRAPRESCPIVSQARAGRDWQRASDLQPNSPMSLGREFLT